MFDVPARLVPLVLRLQGRNRDYRSVEGAERHLADLVANPRRIAPPERTPAGVMLTREERRGWPVFRMTPTRIPATTATASPTTAPTAARPRGTVLYFHGGAYVHGIHAAHWRLLTHLVTRAHVEVLVPMYPLLPEGGTATAVADVAWRLASDAGDDTVLMGDSAGAQIAYAAALDLRDRGVTAPLSVLISPPIDLELRHPGLPARAPLDPWLCRDGLIVYARHWLGEHGFDHRLNPINADPTGLGRVVVFSGSLDLLDLDAADWVARLRGAGVDVEHHAATGEVHVYPLLPTRAGRLARHRVVELLRGL